MGVWNRDGEAAVRTGNITTTHRGKFWKLLLPSPRQSYYFQAFLDDCEVTGKKFASPRLRLSVSNTRVVTRLMFLAHVGFCGKNNIPPQYEDIVDEFGIFA